jgi:hypothetical protein
MQTITTQRKFDEIVSGDINKIRIDLRSIRERNVDKDAKDKILERKKAELIRIKKEKYCLALSSVVLNVVVGRQNIRALMPVMTLDAYSQLQDIVREYKEVLFKRYCKPIRVKKTHAFDAVGSKKMFELCSFGDDSGDSLVIAGRMEVVHGKWKITKIQIVKRGFPRYVKKNPYAYIEPADFPDDYE